MSQSDGTPKESRREQNPKPLELVDAVDLLAVEFPPKDARKSKPSQDAYDNAFCDGWLAAMRRFGIKPKGYQGGKLTW